jgi:hypothetical protein
MTNFAFLYEKMFYNQFRKNARPQNVLGDFHDIPLGYLIHTRTRDQHICQTWVNRKAGSDKIGLGEVCSSDLVIYVNLYKLVITPKC